MAALRGRESWTEAMGRKDLTSWVPLAVAQEGDDLFDEATSPGRC